MVALMIVSLSSNVICFSSCVHSSIESTVSVSFCLIRIYYRVAALSGRPYDLDRTQRSKLSSHAAVFQGLWLLMQSVPAPSPTDY